MSVGRKTGSKPLAFITSLMVLFALVIPFVGTALANHGGGNPTVINAGADDSAPAGTCNEFVVQAFGGTNNNQAAEGETLDIQATQSDGDVLQDLEIGFCDPDGNGPATDLSGTDPLPASGGQTQGGGTALRDCDDNLDPAAEDELNNECTGAAPQGFEAAAQVNEECTTDGNGFCRFGLTSNEAGTMNVRVFFESNDEGDDVRQDGEPFDDVVKTWTAGAGSARNITCTPASDTNPEGTRHEFQCTVTDANGAAVPGATVSFDVTAGPNSEEINRTNCGNVAGSTDTTGNASPAGARTNAQGQTVAPAADNPAGSGSGNTANACGYQDNLAGAASSPPGTDTITAFVNLPAQAGQPAPTSGPDAGEPVTTITKTFVGAGRTIDCEPETATNQVGTSHTVTCTVRDRLNNPVQGAVVDLTLLSGPGTFQPGSGTDQTTNAQGQITATLQTGLNDPAGTSNIRGEIVNNGQDDRAECGTAAGTPQGAPQGVCTDDVTKTWTRSGPTPAQCNDGQDNDGDGRIDAGQDPGCTDSTDNTESPDPAVEPTRVATNLTIRYDPPKFTGSVGSPRKACQRGRKVTLKKVVPGPNRTVGTDTSNREGTWVIRKRRARGRFYAVVARKEYTNSKGVRIICLKDRSVTINTNN